MKNHALSFLKNGGRGLFYWGDCWGQLGNTGKQKKRLYTYIRKNNRFFSAIIHGTISMQMLDQESRVIKQITALIFRHINESYKITTIVLNFGVGPSATVHP